MKRFNLRFILLVAVLSLMALGTAGKVNFQLVPRQNVVAGTNFRITLRLTLENEDMNNIGMPKAPELSGCRLLSGPDATTSQVSESIINGHRSSMAVIDLVCTYRAQNQGKVKIPSVTINVGGKAYHTGEGSFEILPPDASAPQQGQAQGSQHSSGSQAAQLPQSSAKDFFVRVIFSKSSVYEQEGIIATTKMYVPNDRKFGISAIEASKTPVYEGFLSDELERDQRTQIENYNGRNYLTIELSRVLLFPQKSGQLKVTSGVYTLHIQEQVGVIRMYGFGTPRFEEYSYTTPLATGTLNVRALPEPRPADFCGAVGSYEVSASLSPELLRTNESANYRLRFVGTGNVKYLTIPTVTFPATFDKYTPKTDVHTVIQGQTYAGSYTVDYPLVPQEVGKYDIPSQTFSYFDLGKGKYVQLSVAEIPVDVARGSGVATNVEQKSVDARMDDILHIHYLPASTSAITRPIFGQGWYWVLWVLVLAALISSVFVYRRHLKLAADVTGRRNARANRVATRRFKAAAACMKAHKDEQFYEELASALKGYIGDKLGIAQSQLISSTIAEKLEAYGASEQTAAEVLEVLDECEMARFTPNRSDSAMADIYNRASAAIKSIEDVKTKKS